MNKYGLSKEDMTKVAELEERIRKDFNDPLVGDSAISSAFECVRNYKNTKNIAEKVVYLACCRALELEA